MPDQNKTSVDELLKQIDDFEKTVNELVKNIATLRAKILKNKEAYGSDTNKWPKE
ncbi:hypothetical protein HZC34_06505 [Candidatus Saganbacteria bacterium]|nr:hypothetical protein [Candidatus Saganbacteria bacterium]